MSSSSPMHIRVLKGLKAYQKKGGVWFRGSNRPVEPHMAVFLDALDNIEMHRDTFEAALSFLKEWDEWAVRGAPRAVTESLRTLRQATTGKAV